MKILQFSKREGTNKRSREGSEKPSDEQSQEKYQKRDKSSDQSQEKEESTSWGKEFGEAFGSAAGAFCNSAKGGTSSDAVDAGVEAGKAALQYSSANKERQAKLASNQNETLQQSATATKADAAHQQSLKDRDPDQMAFTAPIAAEARKNADNANSFVTDLKEEDPSILAGIISNVNAPNYKKDMEEAHDLTIESEAWQGL